MNLRAIAGSLLITFATGVCADTVRLRSDHPDSYTVVKGDTLWDISIKFLQDPWKWPEIWHKNRQIENPDLIYPGDIINLIDVDGQPRLQVTRGKHSSGKLTPKIRETSYEDIIPVIPLNRIRQFLSKPRIVGLEELEDAPYVVSFADDHIIGGAGDRVYVRSIETGSADEYRVFSPGDAYKDSNTGEILGYEATFVAETELQRTGDPATLLLTSTEREVLTGHRLLPVIKEKLDFKFIPRFPEKPLSGHIIAVVEGVSQIGQYDIVVVDRGAQDGLESGHLLNIYQFGRVIRDVVSDIPEETVVLPDEKAGQLMIFRLFDRLSYGLVLNAKRTMHINDAVRSQ